MTPDERDRLLACLQDLKAKDGRAALTAARAAATLVSDLRTDWDDLLVPAETPEEDHGEEAVEEPAATTPDEAMPAEDCAKELKLIESLLARPNLFDGTRDELLGYKEDIAGGEFHHADRHYLQALSKRLKS